jgi:flagellar biosynthetic protein FliR
MLTIDFSSWMMVFLRAGAMLSVFPVFSSRNVPVRLRVSLAALIAYLISPALPAIALPADVWNLVAMMAGETLIGLLLGFVSRLLFYALEIVGGVIGMQIGLSMPAGMDPFTEHQSNSTGLMLFYLAAVLWLTLDLHHWMLLGFRRTYHFLPVGGAHLTEPLALDLLARTSNLFVIAVQMAAPIIAVSFMVTLVFALMGRVVPQMPVFSESFAFRVLTGLIVIGMTLNLMAQHIANNLRRLPEDILRVAQLLGGGG